MTKLRYFFYSLLFLPATLLADTITTTDLESAANNTTDPILSGMAVAKQLFGDIAANPLQFGVAPSGMISSVLVVINVSLLAMATVWVSWTMIKGSLMTAHDGQFVGKSMHSAWVPFRMTVGIASLVPFFKGLCLAQVIMLYAIQLSIGAGNLAWNKAVEYALNDNNDVLTITQTVQYDNITRSVFNSLVCQYSITAGKYLMHETTPEYGNKFFTDGNGLNHWNFGSNGGQGAECGSYSLPSGISGVSAKSAEIQKTVFTNLVNSLDSFAGKLVSDTLHMLIDHTTNPTFDGAFLAQATAAYNGQIKEQIKVLVAQANQNSGMSDLKQKMKDNATSQGFVTAGAWFFTLSSKNNAASSVLGKGVIVSQSALSPDNNIFIGKTDIYAKVMPLIDSTLIKQHTEESANGIDWLFSQVKKAFSNNKSGTDGSIGQSIVAGLIESGDSQANAIIRIANMGSWITSIGAVGITTVGAIDGAAKAAEDSGENKVANLIGIGAVSTGPVLGAAHAWLDIAAGAFKVLFWFGIICATYIPMIPAIVWLMRMMSIFAIWVEAVVSASVWAFAHLDTDGEGMGQRAGHGYMFLFNVLLNPMLSVLGLVLGTVLLGIMSTFALKLYPEMIANASGDDMTGLLKIIAYLVIFVMVNMSLVNLSMQLINVVPDNIMDWVGGRVGGTLGKGGEDMVGAGVKGSVMGNGLMPSYSRDKDADGGPTASTKGTPQGTMGNGSKLSKE